MTVEIYLFLSFYELQKIGEFPGLTEGSKCLSCNCSCNRSWVCFNFFPMKRSLNNPYWVDVPLDSGARGSLIASLKAYHLCQIWISILLSPVFSFFTSWAKVKGIRCRWGCWGSLRAASGCHLHHSTATRGWELPGPLAWLPPLSRHVQRTLLALLKRVQTIYYCSPDCKIIGRDFIPISWGLFTPMFLQLSIVQETKDWTLQLLVQSCRDTVLNILLPWILTDI